MDKSEVTLDSLIGIHKLDAVDFGSKKILQYGSTEECNTISFRLDGVVYTAIENADDGYRSCLDKLLVDDIEMKNVFPSIKVMAKKKCSGHNQENDTFEFIDIVTGKVVLEVGTDNCDDYYPYFVGNFNPENMATNAKSNKERRS